jgi:hypothetical protein
VNTSALPTPAKMAASGARAWPRSAIVIATTTMIPCTVPPTMTNTGDADIPRSWWSIACSPHPSRNAHAEARRTV